MQIHVEIITPERAVYEGAADAVSIPTPQGEITVLPHHIPLISIVAPGTVTVRAGGEEHLFAVTRGVIEIDGQSIRLLVDTADRAEELEEVAVSKAKEDAQKLMKERRADAEGVAEAAAILDRELARLQVIRRHRSHRGITPPVPGSDEQ
ncbi:MAG: ATP synthase F1 subunit epsilon [Candidatus Peribacteraceae bacterium]|nr:ATP synthase F1 subunit epsilon [Candidatus Peribacteraceae bacterium]